MKKYFLILLITLSTVSPMLFAQKTILSLTTDFAYHPASELIADGSGGSHFASITGPYSGLEACTTFNAAFRFNTPLGEHWLLSDANIMLGTSLELTPISLRPKLSLEFAPLPFLIFNSGASFGWGWNFPGIKGLCEYNKESGEFENLSTFKHPYYDFWAGVRLQFDTGALFEGDWTHVIMLASFTSLYSGIVGLEDKSIYEWQCGKFRAKGWLYEIQGILGYQMPLVLRRIGIMVKSVAYYDGSVYGEFDETFDGDFATVNISPFLQFNFGEKDELSCLFDFSSRRSYNNKIENDRDILIQKASGREWFFNRIALSWTHKFKQ